MSDTYICWTDVNQKRHFTAADNAVVVVPGIIGAATVFVNGYNSNDSTNDDGSQTAPGSIFIVPTIYEALRFVRTGNKPTAIYGTE